MEGGEDFGSEGMGDSEGGDGEDSPKFKDDFEVIAKVVENGPGKTVGGGGQEWREKKTDKGCEFVFHLDFNIVWEGGSVGGRGRRGRRGGRGSVFMGNPEVIR